MGLRVADLPESHIRHDEAGFATMYCDHRARLLGAVLRMTGDHEVAEDIVQDAFLRLLVAAQAEVVPSNVFAWLRRVAINLVIDRSRRRRLRTCAVEISTPNADPETSVIAIEQAETLHRALNRLSDQSRRALLLDGAGYRSLEIASIIGRSEPATRTLLCRSRKRTRALLEEDGEQRAPDFV